MNRYDEWLQRTATDAHDPAPEPEPDLYALRDLARRMARHPESFAQRGWYGAYTVVELGEHMMELLGVEVTDAD